MVWSCLVNLVNVSSLYWQATFARRCLSLRLTWFRQCACFGVELHSLNMSSVMSRVSNGVGCGSRWQLTGSWRCRWKGALLGVAASEQPFWSRPRSASVFRRASGRVAEYFHGMGQDGTGSGANESCRSLPPRSVLTQPLLGTAGQSAEFPQNGTSFRNS